MKRRPYGWLGRVGVLVPPGNTTVEPELVAMLPAGISLHASRLPGRVELDTSIGLGERFLGYNATLSESADSFGGLPLDALSYACTGASYLVGPEGEDRLLEDLRRGGAASVNTASLAVDQALSACGAERIALVSPYPQWLTDRAIGYWNARQKVVVGVAPIASVVSIYDITDEEVERAIGSLDLTGVEAVVLSGTGMATLGAISKVADEIGIPIVSSTSCTAWWLTRTIAPHAIAESSTTAQLERWAGR